MGARAGVCAGRNPSPPAPEDGSHPDLYTRSILSRLLSRATSWALATQRGPVWRVASSQGREGKEGGGGERNETVFEVFKELRRAITTKLPEGKKAGLCWVTMGRRCRDFLCGCLYMAGRAELRKSEFWVELYKPRVRSWGHIPDRELLPHPHNPILPGSTESIQNCRLSSTLARPLLGNAAKVTVKFGEGELFLPHQEVYTLSIKTESHFSFT